MVPFCRQVWILSIKNLTENSKLEAHNYSYFDIQHNGEVTWYEKYQISVTLITFIDQK